MEFVAVVYVIGALADGPTRAMRMAAVLVLVAFSAGRGLYIMFVERPERPLFEIGLPETPWEEANRWLAAQPRDIHVLADPGHAWEYGTSVRVSAERDVLIEEVMFHLFTHAFFKALLFLGSGSVIHAMHHEQDIRNMGGLKDRIPFTYIVMVIGTLALTGFPLTAGYFSKDAIIESAFVSHNPMALYGFICTATAALLTSFYSWRLIFKTFHGAPHDEAHYKAAHESPYVMLIPLGVLALGSVLAGLPFKEIFAGHGVSGFFRESLSFAKDNKILDEIHHVPLHIALAPTVLMAVGFVIAWQFYIRRPDIPVELARQHDVLYRFLLNKWYFDELYDLIFVRPAKWLGRTLWKRGDGWLIDGFGPDGVSARVLDVTRNVVRLQTGYLYHYAFAMLIGAAAFITYFMFAGGVR